MTDLRLPQVSCCIIKCHTSPIAGFCGPENVTPQTDDVPFGTPSGRRPALPNARRDYLIFPVISGKNYAKKSLRNIDSDSVNPRLMSNFLTCQSLISIRKSICHGASHIALVQAILLAPKRYLSHKPRASSTSHVGLLERRNSSY
jgi:hypothetical protein